MTDSPDPQEIDRWHRWMAANLFNRTWELLEAERTREQDRELLATALASWLHWRRVGDATNHAVADWQVSRVYAVLGDPVRAEEHGRASLETAEVNGLGPFYVGHACEALARAAAGRGDGVAMAAWLERARQEAVGVGDEEDRGLLLADLDSLEGAGG
jgi:hypothetical protein